MTKTLPTAHRITAAFIAAVLVLTGIAVGADKARAADFQRLKGADRYGTSVAISQAAFDATTTDVIVARGDGRAFADALAAAGVAGSMHAPVLLTHVNRVSDAVLDEIQRLDPDRLHIAGGLAAVSAEAEAQIDAVTDATIHRFRGRNRYDTARLMADAIGDAGDVHGLDTALIATGRNFPDALAGGPLAYAGGLPILLVDTEAVPTETITALTAGGIDQVIILGGDAVVTPEVETELEDLVGAAAIRLSGQRRFETAIEIANFAIDELGFGTDEAVLARADIAADALAGGPYAGETLSPLVVTNQNELYPATATWLTTTSPELITVLGGVAALEDDVVDAAVAAAEAGDPPGNQSLRVTPAEASTLDVVPGAQTGTPADDRQYTVTGATADVTHTTALFAADDVSVGADGTVTFTDLDDDGVADGYGDTATASIVEVNGTLVDQGGDALVQPVASTITFTLDGLAPGSVVPVVFVDADSDGGLDLGTDDAPVVEEPFGVGGAVHYRPAAAASTGDAADGRVSFTDKDANEVWIDSGSTAGNFTPSDADVAYTYDNGDTFAIAGADVTPETFEQALSGGDELRVGAYDPGSTSDFDIVVDTPLAPATVDAEAGTDVASDDITVTIVPDTPSDAGLYDAFIVQRAPVTGGTDETADGTVGPYATVATATADADASLDGFQYMDADVAEGVYRYRAAGVIAGDEGPFTVDDANEAAVTPDLTPPTIGSASLTADNGLGGLADFSDDWLITFSEAISAAATDDGRIDLEDEDGDYIRLQCGLIVDSDDITSASCALSDGDQEPGDESMAISLWEDAEDRNPTLGDNVIEYPLKISSVGAEFSDGRNTVDLQASTDIDIN